MCVYGGGGGGGMCAKKLNVVCVVRLRMLLIRFKYMNIKSTSSTWNDYITFGIPFIWQVYWFSSHAHISNAHRNTHSWTYIKVYAYQSFWLPFTYSLVLLEYLMELKKLLPIKLCFFAHFFFIEHTAQRSQPEHVNYNLNEQWAFLEKLQINITIQNWTKIWLANANRTNKCIHQQWANKLSELYSCTHKAYMFCIIYSWPKILN